MDIVCTIKKPKDFSWGGNWRVLILMNTKIQINYVNTKSF